MRRTISILVGLFALMLMTVSAKPAAEANAMADQSLPGVFGRELVDKVKKGAIYIWAMAPDDSGFMQPSWIGSGFIFQAVPEENAAYALTNHHVVNGTVLLQCETWDHATYKADMVATEAGIDVGLIKIYNIPPDRYEVNVLGDSDKVQIGAPALAMGAPGSGDSVNSNRSDPMISFGLHQTATMRVVAGIQTDPYEFIAAWTGWRMDLGRQVITNLPWRFVCQSTINGGNSGGPLYNADGEVIGLNHAHFGAGSVITQNENYTIPINFAKNFAYQILDTGNYEIPWFGMDIVVPPYYTSDQQVSEFVERFYNPKVIKVLNVRQDTSAERAGLKTGDIILEFDGQIFPTSTDLRMYIFTLPIGKQVPVLVRRGREKIHLTMEVQPKRSYDSEFSL